MWKALIGHVYLSAQLSIRNLINRHISQLTLPQIGTEVIAMSGYQCTALYVVVAEEKVKQPSLGLYVRLGHMEVVECFVHFLHGTKQTLDFSLRAGGRAASIAA